MKCQSFLGKKEKYFKLFSAEIITQHAKHDFLTILVLKFVRIHLLSIDVSNNSCWMSYKEL